MSDSARQSLYRVFTKFLPSLSKFQITRFLDCRLSCSHKVNNKKEILIPRRTFAWEPKAILPLHYPLPGVGWLYEYIHCGPTTAKRIDLDCQETPSYWCMVECECRNEGTSSSSAIFLFPIPYSLVTFYLNTVIATAVY